MLNTNETPPPRDPVITNARKLTMTKTPLGILEIRFFEKKKYITARGINKTR